MRIFSAIEIPDEVRSVLREQTDLARTLHPQLRWVIHRNLHLTVRFLGDCGDREVDRQLVRWRDHCAAVDPFEAQLVGAGCFPHPWQAKVLYAALSIGVAGWRRLSGVDDIPHVTLARSAEPRDLTGLTEQLSQLRTPSWQIDSVVMLRSSIARGRPPIYSEVERFALGG